MSKTWKAVERRVAKYWGTERTPFSGSNSKITASDSLHKNLFIETKLRTKWSIFTLYNEVEEKAKKEGKIPVLCLHEKNKHGFLIVIKNENLDKIIEERIKVKNGKQTK